MNIELNIDYLKNIMIEKGWNTSKLAKETNYSRSGVSRILNGKRRPGSRFIGGLLSALPEHTYEELFFTFGVANKKHLKESR